MVEKVYQLSRNCDYLVVKRLCTRVLVLLRSLHTFGFDSAQYSSH